MDIKAIPELHVIIADESTLTFGGNVSLTDFMNTLERVSSQFDYYDYAKYLAKHIDLVAHIPVRNVSTMEVFKKKERVTSATRSSILLLFIRKQKAGTIAGNLSIKIAHNEFPSDIFLLLEAIDAKININSVDGLIRTYSPKECLSLDMKQRVILNVVLPKLPPTQYVFRSYKIMPRAQNAHAMINAAFLFEFDTTTPNKRTVSSCRICYGGIEPTFVHAEQTEKVLTGVDELYTDSCLRDAIKSLKMELHPNPVLPDPSPEYRLNLAIGLLYRFYLNTAPVDRINGTFVSGGVGLDRPISSGMQNFETDDKTYPLTEPIPKYDGLIQCAGEAQYSNDTFSVQSAYKELWGAFVEATAVHSKVVGIDASKALVTCCIFHVKTGS